MPSYGQTVTLQYVAWDTGNNVGKTGDSANHTLRWIKDGTSAAPANNPSQIDATNAPGVYKLTLTATECQCQVGTLCGKSSTSGIVIFPITVSFENLPTASPATTGGLPTCGTSDNQISSTAGLVALGTHAPSTWINAAAFDPDTVTSGPFPASLDMTQAVPTSNTAQTVGDALNAARADAFGKWTFSGTTWTLYAGDGTTVVRTFTTSGFSASTPVSRS